MDASYSDGQPLPSPAAPGTSATRHAMSPAVPNVCATAVHRKTKPKWGQVDVGSNPSSAGIYFDTVREDGLFLVGFSFVFFCREAIFKALFCSLPFLSHPNANPVCNHSFAPTLRLNWIPLPHPYPHDPLLGDKSLHIAAQPWEGTFVLGAGSCFT